jgi:hypothetical protein
MSTEPLRSNTEQAPQRDRDDWKTGDEPMKPAQRSTWRRWAAIQGRSSESLTKAEAPNVSMS